jgi:hypothetical protein
MPLLQLRILLLGAFICVCKVGFSETSIANGKIIPESVYPEVVKIYSTFGSQGASCTATVVGHNALLTAAHCLYFFGPKAENVEIISGEHEGLQSIDCYLHPSFPLGSGYYDVALIKFPDNSFKKIIPFATDLPLPGQEFTIVGYGKFSFYATSSDGQKRMGTNNLSGVGRRLDFEGSHKNEGPDGVGTGKNVSNLPGDSGGPMLIGGKIIGVSSTIDARLDDQNRVVGHYEHLLYTENLSFLRDRSELESIHLLGLNQIDVELRIEEHEQNQAIPYGQELR